MQTDIQTGAAACVNDEFAAHEHTIPNIYTDRLGLDNFEMSGMIGCPISSCAGVIFTAQRMWAMLINSESLAMCLPGQILWKLQQNLHGLSRVIPRPKSLDAI